MGYTSLLVRGLIRLFVPHGYTTLLFQGGVYLHLHAGGGVNGVYNPVISGWCIPKRRCKRISGAVYNPVISGWCIPDAPNYPKIFMVYNPVISGWCIPKCKVILSWLLVYNPVISGWCIPSTGIQFPKVLVVASDPTNQPTEYSCFHDDHASPQALIPAIPSVLVFISLAMCAIIAHFIYLV